MLYRIATQAGAEIIHGANVINVIPGAPKDDDSEHSFTSASTPSLVTSMSTLDSTDSSDSDETTCVTVTGHGPPSVILASGQVLTADIVVGVDGSESLVRNVVLKGEDDHGRYTGMNVLS